MSNRYKLTPNIIFEDSDIFVFDKPSGLVVNKSRTTKNPTLQDFLIAHYPKIYEDTHELDGQEFSARCGIVHRIDKDTSGILVVAKTAQAFYNIQRQFKKREVSKKYLAAVIGEISDNRLRINAPLGRNPKIPMRIAVVAGGRESLTDIQKMGEYTVNGHVYTKLLVSPKTGRTHQIRVHLASIRHPIASDPIYCTTKQYDQSSLDFPRLMLHASEIRFTHPKSNETIHFVTDTPQDFLALE